MEGRNAETNPICERITIMLLLVFLFVLVAAASIVAAKSNVPGKLGVILKRVGFFLCWGGFFSCLSLMMGLALMWAMGMPTWCAFVMVLSQAWMCRKTWWDLSVKYSNSKEGEFAQGMSGLKDQIKTWAGSKLTGAIDKLAQ